MFAWGYQICIKYEFHYDYIKNKYRNISRLLFTGTDSLELKRKMYMKILVMMSKCLTLAIILLIQNIMMIQTNQLLVKWDMKQVVSPLKICWIGSKDVFVFGRR